MMLNSGYAIIQYTTPEAAQEAIQEEHRTRLRNKMLTVRLAVLKSERPPTPPPVIEARTVNNTRTPIFPIFETSQSLPTPNEIEIIALTNDVTTYAENIQTNLQNLEYTVDIMYLRRPYSLWELLTDLRTKRTVMALIIRTEDMENHTVIIQQLENLSFNETLPLNVAMQVIENRHRPRALTNRVEHLPVPRNPFTDYQNDPFVSTRRTVEEIVSEGDIHPEQMDSLIGYLENLRNVITTNRNQRSAHDQN